MNEQGPIRKKKSDLLIENHDPRVAAWLNDTLSHSMAHSLPMGVEVLPDLGIA
jgi:hypothetical protein